MMLKSLALLLLLAAPPAASAGAEAASAASKPSAPVLSTFSCSRPKPWEAGALKNVSIAAELIDGMVLKPGDSFSFNDAMEPGLSRFVEGTSYASGRVVTSDGGGICQVSTGLYNAVILAGLEVLERNNHSLYDPAAAYVEAGRDAMVTRVGHADFRFRNSTAEPLTIHAGTLGGRLDIKLEGRQHRRKNRWIEVDTVERRPFGLIQEEDPRLDPGERRLRRRGFDGLKVRSRVCWLDAQGQTRSANLGLSRYMKVNERWAVGPLSGTAATDEAAAPLSSTTGAQP